MANNQEIQKCKNSHRKNKKRQKIENAIVPIEWYRILAKSEKMCICKKFPLKKHGKLTVKIKKITRCQNAKMPKFPLNMENWQKNEQKCFRRRRN